MADSIAKDVFSVKSDIYLRGQRDPGRPDRPTQPRKQTNLPYEQSFSQREPLKI